MIDALGWVATALFASSYLFKRPAALRKVQALAAALWVVYGAVIHALPVVVANLLVAGMAIWSSVGWRRRDRAGEPLAQRVASGEVFSPRAASSTGRATDS